jgi:ligand-binding sensor domain-containing protein
MKRFLLPIGSLCAAALLSLALAGCPMQASYKSTITPIYAATSSGLWVYNGSSWAQYLASSVATSVVVSGSGSGADVFVGTASSGVSHTASLGAWSNWSAATNGLGSDAINRLFLGSSLYAATTNGLSILQSSSTWNNNSSMGSVNDVFCYGDFTFVATTTGLSVYNGTALVKKYTTADGFASNNATAVVGYSASDFYVGTASGFYYYNGSTLAPYLVGQHINYIFIDSNYNLYAATTTGLYDFSISLSTPIYSNDVLSVFVDGAGTIYAGTSANGLQISRDGGSTWSSGLTFAQTGTVNAVVTTAPLYSF